MNLVMRVSDKVVALEFGIKIADGTPDEVRAEPEVIRAYLGDEDDEAMPALLEATRLARRLWRDEVLHGIDFSVEEGGVTALLGANGAGKTTTLRAICGMVRTQRRNLPRRRTDRRHGDRGHRAARRRARAGRPRHVHGTDGRGEPAPWRLSPQRPRGGARISSGCSATFPGCGSATASRPARCRAASSNAGDRAGAAAAAEAAAAGRAVSSAWRR